MAELIAIPGAHGDIACNVIFFHGLGGHAHKTWLVSSEPKVCWLQWLAEDIEGLGVWTVGYYAAASRWRGSAMPLADRATNVLQRVLAEPRLQDGGIILIGQSLGGLLIKTALAKPQRALRISTKMLPTLSGEFVA